MQVLLDVSCDLAVALVNATYQKPKPKTTISRIFCCLEIGRELTSGRGRIAVAKSVAAFTPAAEYQTPSLLRQVPSMVLSQKCCTGAHMKKPLKIAHRLQAVTVAIKP